MDPTKPRTLSLPGAVLRTPLVLQQQQQQQQARGRGLPPEEPAAGRGRGQPFSTGGVGVGRGFITTPGDAVPMQFGRGAAMLPASLSLVGFARGLPITQDWPGVGRARGMLFSVGEPQAGTAAGAPFRPGLEPQPGHGQPSGPERTEEKPEIVSQGEGMVRTFDMPGHGSSLVSMFRGMGLEPPKASWGRGQQPVGRMAAGDAEVKLPPGPAGVLASPETDEKPQDNRGQSSSFSFLGRGLPTRTVMPGIGRTSMPHVGLGRGPPVAPSPPQGPLSPAAAAATTTFSLPTPPPSPSAAGTAPAPSPEQSPGTPTQGPLMMEPTREPLNKRGTKGNPITIGSNHTRISCKNEAVYQYHVSFTPPIESMAMRFGMLKDHRPTTGDVVAFDGSTLFLPTRMDDVVLLKSKRRTDNEDIEIKIQMVKILPPNSDYCIPFYSVVLRRIMKMVGLKLVGRNHYDPQSAVVLGKLRLQVWPGYATSIKKTDGGLFLSVDVTHKVLRNDSVLNAMNMIYQQGRENFQEQCAKELVGAIVITRYNNRTYRVDDVEWNKSPKDTFTLADGSSTTFVDYYSKNYGITIKELDQPLLVHRPKERSKQEGRQIITGEILLVPELSFMTGTPDEIRKDFRAMKDLTMHINVNTAQHTSSVNQLLHKIRTTPDTMEQLTKWGLEISGEVLVTQGRTLPLETICLQSASAVPGPDMSWSRDVVREASISCIPLHVWAIFYPQRCANQTEELVTTFRKVAGPMGLRLEQPIKIELRDDRTETYLKSIHSQLTSVASMQMVVCIITGNRDDLYSAIKKLCCVKSPIPSQVINARTISQPQKLRSVAQKILLQMNCKVGGELWTVDVPLKHLMVIGVDVHHDTSQRNRSVMGFVASLNSLLTQWYSRVTFQSPNEEIINGFQVCLLAALQKYYEVNHNLPEKIVVYRDGVSDSQLKVVAAHEVPQLLKSFETFPSYEPKLVFIVVQKRISTTLHAVTGDRLVTPPPGTILDHTLTQRDWVDFYLMAHHIRHGCGFPTHYVSVYNTSSLTPDHLQRLTYKMCHLYWNWPGTIRVPAPCKYAHKLAYLSGQYLHAEPAIQLSDLLYFL